MRTKLFIVSTALFLAALPLAANAADWKPLSDTGQTTCYDVVGTVIHCPPAGEALHGQDANYGGRQQVYQDNGNATVTDLNTGLMWQKSDDGTTRSWQDAFDYCLGIDDGGYDDWRLPEHFELQSIADYGRVDPAINPVFSCRSSYYWTATIYASHTTNAWVVYFYDGNDTAYFMIPSNYVRCVRAGL